MRLGCLKSDIGDNGKDHRLDDDDDEVVEGQEEKL